MATIRFVRHQAAGVLYDFPFADEPTAKQLDALTAFCELRHGKAHPKTGEPYWLRVVEVTVLGASDAPRVGPVGVVGNDSAEATVPEFSVDGIGSVSNP